MRYSVKNFTSSSNKGMQDRIKDWIESRKHITIISTNIWTSKNEVYATVVYMEDNYVG